MINVSVWLCAFNALILGLVERRRLICRSIAATRPAANSRRTLIARPTVTPIMTSLAAADSAPSFFSVARLAKGRYR